MFILRLRLNRAGKRPAVIFLNTVGDTPESKPKDWAIYRSWARLVASQDLIGVTMESKKESIQENLRTLFAFIEHDGARYGIDAARLGVYAASANVSPATTYLLGNSASKGIKAAALYYGGSPDGQLRKDLRVMFILAEGDLNGGLGRHAVSLWQQVAEARAPWTLVFGSNQPHAFDSFSNTEEARRLIWQTIAFWKTNLEQAAPSSLKLAEERAIMAAIYGNDSVRVVELLKPYLQKHPDDAIGVGQYGAALQELKRFDEAMTAFQKALAISPNDVEIHGAIGQLYFAQGRYSDAIESLHRAISGGLDGPGMYNQLATAQMAVNRREDAIRSYEKAIEKGFAKRAAYYNIACAYVRLKQNDRAFEYLNKAIDEGFMDRRTLENDTDLAPIRTDARFQQILVRVTKL